MQKPGLLPESLVSLKKGELFSFSCHKDVKCFTECCRMLELAVTPFDVLRLKKAKGLRSRPFLDSYIIMEQDPGEAFPRFYLTMIDDGRASCVFVGNNGCTVYDDRPGACRAYPMGRAVAKTASGRIDEHFVLMKESHCLGFFEKNEQTAESYSEDQALVEYNRFNDGVAQILQHESIRNGFSPSKKQVEQFTTALYDIDNFRKQLFTNKLTDTILSDTERKELESDENLLFYAIQWLKIELFNNSN